MGEGKKRRNTPFSRTHIFFLSTSAFELHSPVVVALALHYKHFKTTQLVGRSRGIRDRNETKDTRREETRDVSRHGFETRPKILPKNLS